MRGERHLRLLIIIVLAAASVRPFILQMYAMNRPALAAYYDRLFDRGTPEYPSFLRAVADATPPGSSVAVLVPMRRWDDGYSYAYYRASYFLAGREVLPLVWRDDRVLSRNLDRADYVASWRLELGGAGLEPVLQAHGGTLYRRKR